MGGLPGVLGSSWDPWGDLGLMGLLPCSATCSRPDLASCLPFGWTMAGPRKVRRGDVEEQACSRQPQEASSRAVLPHEGSGYQ